jgi:VCBS repeat-containing protein
LIITGSAAARFFNQVKIEIKSDLTAIKRSVAQRGILMSNSAAVIGTPTVQTVTEDSNQQTLVAAGSISISDANAGQAAFKTTVIAASGDLGTMTIAANGAYVYAVADSKVQYLGAGQTKVDTFTVTSLDGTTKQVTFTIIGVNDAAVIGAPTVVDVTEDASNPTLKAVGSISISDADQGQAAFKTSVTSAAGNLGNLVLAANGTYTYSVANSAVQYLGAGQTKVAVHGGFARRHHQAGFLHHSRRQ